MLASCGGELPFGDGMQKLELTDVKKRGPQEKSQTSCRIHTGVMVGMGQGASRNSCANRKVVQKPPCVMVQQSGQASAPPRSKHNAV